MAHPGHVRSFDYRGRHRYFLTFSTFRRQRLFVSHSTVAATLAQFLRAARAKDFAVLAYCFMPDHVQLLVQGVTGTSHGLSFFSTAKQLSGSAFQRRRGGRLWQRDCHEHVLRDTERTLVVAKYIFESPVRAGLVSAPFEYPFSGSERYSLDQLVELLALERGCWEPDDGRPG